jgi:hypothetical protein
MEITITTQPCFHCKQTSKIKVDKNSYDNYINGALIQNAFPTLDPQQRELIATGFHPQCWDKVFS